VSAVGALRLAAGLAQLTLPERVGRALLGHPPDARERGAIRVLGLRHLAQREAARRGHDLLAGPGLDAVHAASMVALAVASPRYRRSALTSAALATGFAAAARFR
jgi:NAD(P)H-hydrate repair Nnr-like enzyme with NAD(P)H-hydrate dehydratase domain